MKTWLAWLLGIAVLIALLYVLSLVAGLLYWGLGILVIGGLLWLIVRVVAREPPLPRAPGRLDRHRSLRTANRALKQLRRDLKADDRRPPPDQE
jgi:hypothetical protein